MDAREILNPIMDEVEDGTLSPYTLEIKLLAAFEQYASPLKERIKELEAEYKELEDFYCIVENECQKLKSQLKEADSKAVRFAEWLGKNCTRMTTATYWVYNGQNYYSEKELFEIFEQENK